MSMTPVGFGHSETPVRPRTRRPVVLVVEDTLDQRDLFATELNSAGFDVVEAADGETAIQEALRSNPQAIVLDLMLPGVSGFNVARLLRANEQTQDALIVAVTALTSDTFRTYAFESGCNSVLRKPVIGATVVGEIVRLLAKRLPGGRPPPSGVSSGPSAPSSEAPGSDSGGAGDHD
jgi:DNA-binding response OmpR family regulator